MATTNFIDNQTLIMASWANDVNAKTYGVAYATAAGTADALTATIPAPVIALVGGTMIYVAAIAANATTTPTIDVNGLGAKTITKFNNAALVAGDIGGASHNMALLYNAVTSSWVLLNPAAVTAIIDATGPITIVDGVTSITSQTGTGTKFVVDTSPALVTPALGTPTSGNLASCTGLPVAGIAASTVSPLGVGSIDLGHATDTTITRTGAGAIAVEGVAVLLSGGALGTPSSGSLANCTGLLVAGGGTGVTTLTGIVKGNGAAAMSAATPSTDYVVPTDLNAYLKPLVTTLSSTGGTINLTAAQNMSTSFEVTGALISNLTVVTANTMAPFTVDNITTGAFTVTFKTAAGVSVAVAQGTRTMLYANGVDVEAVSVIAALAASALKSATTSVDTAAAAAPTAGQVLKASSGTAATWATPTGGWGF